MLDEQARHPELPPRTSRQAPAPITTGIRLISEFIALPQTHEAGLSGRPPPTEASSDRRSGMGGLALRPFAAGLLANTPHPPQWPPSSPGLQALRHRLRAMPGFGSAERIGQNALGVKPPALDPGRTKPPIDWRRRGGYQPRRIDLLDRGIPIQSLRAPFRANEAGRHTVRPDLQLVRR